MASSDEEYAKEMQDSFTVVRHCVDVLHGVRRTSGLDAEVLHQVLQELDLDPGDFHERLSGAANDWDT